MIFNQSNITNRTVLARCCFADMVIDMMEARTIGDTDTYECKKRKAMFLNYTIGEMCTYIDEGVFNERGKHKHHTHRHPDVYGFRVGHLGRK